MHVQQFLFLKKYDLRVSHTQYEFLEWGEVGVGSMWKYTCRDFPDDPVAKTLAPSAGARVWSLVLETGSHMLQLKDPACHS